MRSLLRAALRRTGFDIRRVGADEPRLDMQSHLQFVASRGFRPATVVDVGAAEGTPPLLETFPDAFHLLVEPLAEHEPQLRAVLSRVKGEYRIAAANEDGRSVTMNVHPDHLHGSSLLKEEMGPEWDGAERVVPGIRLDDLWAEAGAKGPALLKIDVQGAELTVLRGAPKMLESVELVILEVAFFEFMKSAPGVLEVMGFMADLGFSAYDLFGLSYRPLDRALGQIDISFARTNGFLRQSHRWA